MLSHRCVLSRAHELPEHPGLRFACGALLSWVTLSPTSCRSRGRPQVLLCERACVRDASPLRPPPRWGRGPGRSPRAQHRRAGRASPRHRALGTGRPVVPHSLRLFLLQATCRSLDLPPTYTPQKSPGRTSCSAGTPLRPAAGSRSCTSLRRCGARGPQGRLSVGVTGAPSWSLSRKPVVPRRVQVHIAVGRRLSWLWLCAIPGSKPVTCH